MTKLKTVSIKGKSYVTVNDRLKYYCENHAGFCLETEVIEVTADTALMRAVIRNAEGVLVATGVAREVRTDTNSFINKTSYVENCETSAWGRALANFGIGIDENVATADEVSNAINQEPVEKKAPTLAQVMEALNNCTDQKSLDTFFVAATKYEWSLEDSGKIVECKQNVLNRLSPSL